MAVVALIHVQSKFAKFALHLEVSNADFAPQRKERHIFRDQNVLEIAISANFQKYFVETSFLLCLNYLSLPVSGNKYFRGSIFRVRFNLLVE